MTDERTDTDRNPAELLEKGECLRVRVEALHHVRHDRTDARFALGTEPALLERNVRAFADGNRGVDVPPVGEAVIGSEHAPQDPGVYLRTLDGLAHALN